MLCLLKDVWQLHIDSLKTGIQVLRGGVRVREGAETVVPAYTQGAVNQRVKRKVMDRNIYLSVLTRVIGMDPWTTEKNSDEQVENEDKKKRLCTNFFTLSLCWGKTSQNTWKAKFYPNFKHHSSAQIAHFFQKWRENFMESRIKLTQPTTHNNELK